MIVCVAGRLDDSTQQRQRPTCTFQAIGSVTCSRNGFGSVTAEHGPEVIAGHRDSRAHPCKQQRCEPQLDMGSRVHDQQQPHSASPQKNVQHSVSTSRCGTTPGSTIGMPSPDLPCSYRLLTHPTSWCQACVLCTTHDALCKVTANSSRSSSGKRSDRSPAEASNAVVVESAGAQPAADEGFRLGVLLDNSPATTSWRLVSASVAWGGWMLAVSDGGDLLQAQPPLPHAGSPCTTTRAWPWERVADESQGIIFQQVAAGESTALALDCCGSVWQLEAQHLRLDGVTSSCSHQLWDQHSGGGRSCGSSKVNPLLVRTLGDSCCRKTKSDLAPAAKPAAVSALTAAAVVEDGSLLRSQQHAFPSERSGAGASTLASAPRLQPWVVPVLAVAGLKIRQVCCGGKHCVAVSEHGAVYSWGWGGQGATGQGQGHTAAPAAPPPAAAAAAAAPAAAATPTAGSAVECPRLVLSLAGDVHVVQAAAGLSHTLLLSDLGDVYSCGWNGNGQLGQGDRLMRSEPTLIDALTGGVLKVSCGGRHSLALVDAGDNNRELWAWGWGAQGQLGLGPPMAAAAVSATRGPATTNADDAAAREGLAKTGVGATGMVVPRSCAVPQLVPLPRFLDPLVGGVHMGVGRDRNIMDVGQERAERPACQLLDVEGGRWHTLILMSK